MQGRIKNDHLNEHQKLFCHYLLEFHNQTKAYQLAYHCRYSTAEHHAWNLVVSDKVQRYLSKAHKKDAHSAHMTTLDVIHWWAKLINSDIGDYVSFGYKDGHNYVHFKDSSNVDTSMVQSIEDGKQGAKIKLYDKKNALQSLYDVLPHASANQNQLGMPGSLYYAITHGVKENDHQDQLKHEVKQLKAKIKKMKTNESK